MSLTPRPLLSPFKFKFKKNSVLILFFFLGIERLVEEEVFVAAYPLHVVGRLTEIK